MHLCDVERRFQGTKVPISERKRWFQVWLRRAKGSGFKFQSVNTGFGTQALV